jgi:putative oxidoreductase
MKKKSVDHNTISSRLVIVMVILRLWLGGLFVYTGIQKIFHIVKFKDIIANYEVLPYWMINITAIILPWLEFWAGIFIIAGIFVRACTIIQIILLLIFAATISFNIARGLDFSCGCFSEANTATGMNYQHIIFNISLVVMASLLYFLERRRFSHIRIKRSVQ